MLRLIIAAVLASACLAFPQRREGAPADMANLKSFDPGMQAMQGPMPGPNLQGMQGMPGSMATGQFLPFNPNLGFGFKRAADENLEKRKHHADFKEDAAPFQNEEGTFDLSAFLKQNADRLPFANIEGDTADLGNFEPSAEQENQFRFFDKQQ